MSVVSNQSFKMFWSSNILIMTLALVSMTDGSPIALSPFVYNSQFRQMPDFNTFKNEELGKMLIKIRILFKSTKDTVPEVDFHHSELLMCLYLMVKIKYHHCSFFFQIYQLKKRMDFGLIWATWTSIWILMECEGC